MEIDFRINGIAYGYIEAPWNQEWDECWTVHHHNKQVLANLPLVANESSIFSREMFLIPELLDKSIIQTPEFAIQLINFTGTFSDQFYLDKDWLQQFENLLRQLFWDRAIIQLSFTDYRYKWETDPNIVKENLFRNPLRPTTTWVRKCFRMEEKEIELNSLTLEPLPS